MYWFIQSKCNGIRKHSEHKIVTTHFYKAKIWHGSRWESNTTHTLENKQVVQDLYLHCGDENVSLQWMLLSTVSVKSWGTTWYKPNYIKNNILIVTLYFVKTCFPFNLPINQCIKFHCPIFCLFVLKTMSLDVDNQPKHCKCFILNLRLHAVNCISINNNRILFDTVFGDSKENMEVWQPKYLAHLQKGN